MARRRKRLSPLQHRLRGVGFGLVVMVGLATLVLLLPIIIPIVGISLALEERRLARFKCLTCGEPLGREEIRRARREAVVEGRPWGGPLDTIRRRIVTIWHVTCPACSHRYTYRPGQPRAALESHAGAGGHAA